MNLINIINLFILTECAQCVVKFHFNRKYNTSNIDKTFNYINYILNNDLITEISIGTPFQKIPISIRMEQEPTYLTPPFLNGLFNSNNSKTFYSDFIEGEYGDEIIKKAYSFQDNINLDFLDNEKIISNITFLYAIKQKSKRNKLNLGNLGLYYKPYSGNNSLNLIFQLKNKNLISSLVYSFNFINDNEGDLYIGEYPHIFNKSYFNDFNLNNINVNLLFVWSSQFDKITFGNDIIEIKRFYLNSSLGGIIGPKKFLDNIQKLYFNQKIKENKCKILNENIYIYFECNKDLDISDFPNLDFYLKENNLNFNINYNDLFEVINDKLYCKLIFQKYNTLHWYLGIPFLKKYIVAFDQDKKLFTFYKMNNEKTNFIPLYLLICFVLILILSRYYKPKRIRSSEIDYNLIDI